MLTPGAVLQQGRLCCNILLNMTARDCRGSALLSPGVEAAAGLSNTIVFGVLGPLQYCCRAQPSVAGLSNTVALSMLDPSQHCCMADGLAASPPVPTSALHFVVLLHAVNYARGVPIMLQSFAIIPRLT